MDLAHPLQNFLVGYEIPTTSARQKAITSQSTRQQEAQLHFAMFSPKESLASTLAFLAAGYFKRYAFKLCPAREKMRSEFKKLIT